MFDIFYKRLGQKIQNYIITSNLLFLVEIIVFNDKIRRHDEKEERVIRFELV